MAKDKQKKAPRGSAMEMRGGAGEREQGLGRASPITRAPRPEPAPPAIDDPGELMRRTLNAINTPLRANSGHPTLAERMRAEIAQKRAKRAKAAKKK